jgi:hypothetical protein
MTLEEYAYLAEIVGVVLIVASLIYVAQQMRQNTNMMRSNAASEFLERDFNVVTSMIESREVGELWVKGERDFESLDQVDRHRILMFERRALDLWHHEFNMRVQGLFPDYKWENQKWLIQNIGRRQAIREAWRVFGQGYEPAYQEFMDEQFTIADGATD